MINKISEHRIHRFRWILAIGWLILIFSSFYDPISLWLTHPDNLASPFRVNANACISIQGECLPQVAYVLAPRIFWGIIVPLSIIILVLGGHETWRRICPLSFFSQIPRRLGIGRKVQKISPTSGIARSELVGVKPDSWLGRNYLYLQLFLFYLGLNIRILFANGNGAGFGIFLSLTIVASIIVGYLFKGKSWCQYFCPMAPVQIFFTGTRGVMGSDAHLGAPGKITQSMCRTIDPQGNEKSACVGCQSACLDIDVQRNYWDTSNQPDRQLLFYGYFGLMVGFFVYLYLYSGSWDYYYSGSWSHDIHQLTSLFGPGFYIAGKAIPIPKIVAAPLTLAVFMALSYYISRLLEKAYRYYIILRGENLRKSEIRHRCYSICVFISFNIFFGFVLRAHLQLCSEWIKFIFDGIMIVISTLWLFRSLTRDRYRYYKENLTASLRRQLQKFGLNWQGSLEGRSLKDLNTDEVYILAKVLPQFGQESLRQVYKGILEEALATGKTQSQDSLEILDEIREQLKVTEAGHYDLLALIADENPQFLIPLEQRSQAELFFKQMIRS
jgi:hypothetical protein